LHARSAQVRPQSLSAAPILEPEDQAERRITLAGSDQRVEPGRQVRVPVRERMPVAIQPNRHGGVPGPGRDLLRVRPAAFYNRDRGAPERMRSGCGVAAGLEVVGRESDYFSSLNRYLFLAEKRQPGADPGSSDRQQSAAISMSGGPAAAVSARQRHDRMAPAGCVYCITASHTDEIGPVA
jgi:hypothetical protein